MHTSVCSRAASVHRSTPRRRRQLDAGGGRDGLIKKDTPVTYSRATRTDADAYIDSKIMTDRTTLRLSDERKRLLDQASAIVASGPGDDPPRSDVIDAALTHLIQSEQNLDDVRDAGDLDPQTIKRLANTDVLRYRYRSSVDSNWR
jgi:hypothetical protein